MNIDEVAFHFDNAKEYGGGYLADCPLCHTRHLHINQKDSKILLYCQHDTCQNNVTTADICGKVGLKPSDLFDDGGQMPAPLHRSAAPKAQKERYHYQAIPKTKAVKRGGPRGDLMRTHEYQDQNGEVIGIKAIYRNPEKDGGKMPQWFAPDQGGYIGSLGGRKMPFYNLPALLKAPPEQAVYIVEGEKDVDNMTRAGLLATTAPNGGGQAKWLPIYEQGLKGRKIVVITDNDETGEHYGRFIVAHTLPIAAGVRLVPSAAIYPQVQEKGDISDIMEAIGQKQALEALAEAVAAADPIQRDPDNVAEMRAERSHMEARDRLTIETLEDELRDRGISVRHNVISNAMEVTGYHARESAEHIAANLPVVLYSELCNDYKSCSSQTITEYLRVIATRNEFNPVLDMLNAGKWDGRDHLAALYDALGIDNADKLSRILILKWIWQGHALLRNDPVEPYGADGILTLAGEQGTGKTSTFAKLAIKSKFFRDGQHLSDFDKDCQRRCVTTWICELGEIDATLRKSDAGMLKSFITSPYDEYRLPYGRIDQQNPRHTNLCATVNVDQESGQARYLVDPTGNRRFWTVPVHDIDLDKINALDPLQIWLQVWEQHARKDLQGFRLTKDEQKLLAERNGLCEKELKGEAEVRDILLAAKNDRQYKVRPATVTQFKMEHTTLQNLSTAQVGRALTKLGYAEDRKRLLHDDGEVKLTRFRMLPMRADCSCVTA